jgi:hypothetical protein
VVVVTFNCATFSSGAHAARLDLVNTNRDDIHDFKLNQFSNAFELPVCSPSR